MNATSSAPILRAAALSRIMPPSSMEALEQERTHLRPDPRLRPNYLEPIPRSWAPFIDITEEKQKMHDEANASQPTTGVGGHQLLREVYDFIGRFVSYPSTYTRIAHTLWIAHAHMMDAWETTPRIAFLSAEPGSGKTRALEVTEILVPRPVNSINASPAYIFRRISDEAGLPTILFDEVDTVFGPKAKENEELRGVLNAGHRRGATAGRCAVRGKEVFTEELPAYCALAVAGLGDLPDTILTRSVVVRMRRRAPGEVVEQYRRRIHEPQGHAILEKIAAWAKGIEQKIRAEWPDPAMPDEVEDRAADNWESLLAVADAAGGDWPKLARQAAVALVTQAKESTPSLGVRLLSDLRTVFGVHRTMTTVAILKALHTIEEAPWGDLKGKPLDDRRLAKILNQYGVKSKTIRTGPGERDVARGYTSQDLHDPWTRYLGPPPHAHEGVTSDTTVTTEAGSADGVQF